MTDKTGSVGFTGTASASGVRRMSPGASPVVIVDACQYGRLGLQCLLTAVPDNAVAPTYARVEEALAETQKRRTVREAAPADERSLVLRLSVWPAQALQQLLQLEGAAMAQAGFHRLIVLSPFGVNNVIRHVLICCDTRLPVRMVNARSPVAGWEPGGGSAAWWQEEGGGVLLPRMPALVLSAPERRTLSGTLQEIPIHRQARQWGVNAKTLYTQRHNALMKLRASGISSLLRRFVSM